MAFLPNIWLGDARCKQMLFWLEKSNDINYLLTDRQSDFSWFNTTAKEHLKQYPIANANLIFMLGFTDCLNSCVYPLDITQIAKDYVEELKDLREQNNNTRFYICSVNPVELDYPLVSLEDKVVNKDLLIQQINTFNTTLKTQCESLDVIFIDSCSYLTSYSFDTRDGFHFTSKTYKKIYNYISSHLASVEVTTKQVLITNNAASDENDDNEDSDDSQGSGQGPNQGQGDSNTNGSTPDPEPDPDSTTLETIVTIEDNKNTITETDFIPRIKSVRNIYSGYDVEKKIEDAPKAIDPPEVSKYWFKSSGNTLGNACIAIDKITGWTLPNCTGYAWGRFWEIAKARPNNLSAANAELWYGNTSDGFERSDDPSKPEVGAIICWAGAGNEAGHVAIVERINKDGTIDTSESGYDRPEYWWSTHRWQGKNGQWTHNGQVTVGKDDNGKEIRIEHTRRGEEHLSFQGFIYNPAVHNAAKKDTAKAVQKTRAMVRATEDPVEEVGEDYLAPVTKDQVISENRYLTEAETIINAKYVKQYLYDRGWSINAIAAILGNMEAESGINPGRWQDGSGPGFGLVQWTPPGKESYADTDNLDDYLASWCYKRGLDVYDIDSQLERIIWEKDNGKQYYKNHYKYTFSEFIESVDDPYTLACAFAFDYERPGISIWGFHQETCSYCGTIYNNDDNCLSCYTRQYGEEAAAAKAEENKQILIRDKRGGYAQKWYKFFLPGADVPQPPAVTTAGAGTDNSGAEEVINDAVVDFTKTSYNLVGAIFRLNNFQYDKITSTSVDASFIVVKGKTGKFKLVETSNDKEVVSEGNLNVNNEEELVTIVKVSCASLVPNTEYKLMLEITGDPGGDKRTPEIIFTTLQDYPDNITDLTIAPVETNIKAMPDSSFNITFTPTANWGYWKNNEKGYDLLLYVNGRKIAEKALGETASYLLALQEYSTQIKVTDLVQVCIRSWVKDADGQPVYSDDFGILSEPICFLSSNARVYLNKNKLQ